MATLVACEGGNKAKALPTPTPTVSKAPQAELLPEGADMTFPNQPPVIKTHSGGGFDGGSRGGIEVWADGSVRFTLDKCTKAPRRGKLPPERVSELVAALDKVGVFAAAPNDFKHACCDCVSTSLTVRSGAKTGTLVDPGCGSEPTPTFGAALALVYDTVGTGTCAWPVPSADEMRKMEAEMVEAMAKADLERDTGKLKASPNSALVQVFIMGGPNTGTTKSDGFSIRRDGTVSFEGCNQTKTVPPDVLAKLTTELGKVPWVSNAEADHGVRPGPDCVITDVIINVDIANVRRRGGCGSQVPPEYTESLALATAAAGTNPCAKK